MSRVAYVNGQFVLHGDACVSIDDRGYQFADGVYEVCEVRDNQIIDIEGHLDRLAFSLGELDITPPMGRAPMIVKMKQTIKRNYVENGLIYLQVSRGVAPRDHAYPKDIKSSIVMTAKSVAKGKKRDKYLNGIAVITVAENRWKRPDIKTIGLLPNCMAKQEAYENGAFEAWFVDDDGMVVEGSSSNAWIVNDDDEIVTRNANGSILKGITRAAILKQIDMQGLKIVERAFSLSEAIEAREAFISSATTVVMPVVQIDNHQIADGKVGALAKSLLTNFYQFAQKTDV